MTPPSITLGLTPSIVSRYSAFVLDQYGVLHDGAKPLPGAVECVAHLKASNKKLAILSNTSASPEAALERLYSTLGFAPGSFDVAVTSGGECSKHFREKISTPDKVTKVLLFTWSGEEAKIKTSSFLSSLGNVEITANPAECDVAVAHGSDLVLGDIKDLGGEVEVSMRGNGGGYMYEERRTREGRGAKPRRAMALLVREAKKGYGFARHEAKKGFACRCRFLAANNRTDAPNTSPSHVFVAASAHRPPLELRVRGPRPVAPGAQVRWDG